MGGHALYRTVEGCLRFIRMWLNDGQGEHGVVLQPETVQMAVQNHLGDLKVSMLPGVIPAYSNDMEIFPGLSKSWSPPFMVNDELSPTGRPAGALGWAGGRQSLLLDRSRQRVRRVLGDPDPAVRGRHRVRQLPGVRDHPVRVP